VLADMTILLQSRPNFPTLMPLRATEVFHMSWIFIQWPLLVSSLVLLLVIRHHCPKKSWPYLPSEKGKAGKALLAILFFEALIFFIPFFFARTAGFV